MKSLPSMGAGIAAMFATFVVGGSGFLLLLDHRKPGPGWALAAITLIALYLEYRFLPGLRERYALRTARQEGRRLLKAVSRSMKKERNWNGSDTLQKIQAAQQRVVDALPGTDTARIEEATKALEDLAEKVFTRKSLKREYVEQIGAALLAALLLRAFFYEAFKIPSGSMLPTLDIGDHLFVNKFIYGLRIPFTVKKIFTQYPQRGDIVVFNRPDDTAAEDIIKRVIGLPNDVIQVKDRHITVNGVPLQTHDLPEMSVNNEGDSDQETDVGPFTRMQPFEETVGTHHHVAYEIVGAPQYRPKEGVWVVKPGHVFVMGDNRDNSADSRFGPDDPGNEKGFGQVPVEYIKGRADIIWLSYGGPHGIRFDRLFKRLH